MMKKQRMPKEVYPAVMYARNLIREDNIPIGLACYKSAKNYYLDTKDVAGYLNGRKKTADFDLKDKWIYWIVTCWCDANTEEQLYTSGVSLVQSVSLWYTQNWNYWRNKQIADDYGGNYAPVYEFRFSNCWYEKEKDCTNRLRDSVEEFFDDSNYLKSLESLNKYLQR